MSDPHACCARCASTGRRLTHTFAPFFRFAQNFREYELDDYELPSRGTQQQQQQQQHAPNSEATATLIGALGLGFAGQAGPEGAPMSRERFAAALQRAARDPLVIEKAFAQYLAFVGTDGSDNSEAAANAGEEQADAVGMSRGDVEADRGGALLPDPHVAPAASGRSSAQSAGPVDALEQLRAYQGQQNAAPPPAPAMPLNTPPKMDALEQLRAFQQGPPPSLAGGADRRRGGGAGGLAALGLGAMASPPPPQQQQQQSGQNLVDKLAAMMQQQQH